MQRVMIGHDAEVFITDQEGRYIPSCGLFGGTKRNPKVYEGSQFGVKYQEDCVTVEFNQDPVPAYPIHGDCPNPSSVFNAGLAELHDLIERKGYWLAKFTDSAKFTPEQLAIEGASTFGCDPDFCAYENPDVARPAPDPKELGDMRCAAGHLHIGYSQEESGIPPFAMVRMLEALVYVRWLEADPQPVRRKFYGLAGLFRPKKYGVEWRTPSNFWLMAGYNGRFVNEVGRCAHNLASRPDQARAIFQKFDWNAVRRAINSEKASANLRELSQQQYNELCANNG